MRAARLPAPAAGPSSSGHPGSGARCMPPCGGGTCWPGGGGLICWPPPCWGARCIPPCGGGTCWPGGASSSSGHPGMPAHAACRPAAAAPAGRAAAAGHLLAPALLGRTLHAALRRRAHLLARPGRRGHLLAHLCGGGGGIRRPAGYWSHEHRGRPLGLSPPNVGQLIGVHRPARGSRTKPAAGPRKARAVEAEPCGSRPVAAPGRAEAAAP